MVRREGLGGKARQAQRAPQGQGCGRAQARGHSASHVDRRDWVQLVEEGDCCLATRLPSSCQTAGKDVPAGTRAMGSSTDFLRASERTTAIATLNRQRHLTPSCGGFTPTAERTVDPARTIIGELDTQTRNSILLKPAERLTPLAASPRCRAKRSLRVRMRSAEAATNSPSFCRTTMPGGA